MYQITIRNYVFFPGKFLLKRLGYIKAACITMLDSVIHVKQ